MKSSIPRIIGWDMIENQMTYVNKIFDLKMGVTSHALREWRSLGRRLAFSRPAIGVLSAGD